MGRMTRKSIESIALFVDGYLQPEDHEVLCTHDSHFHIGLHRIKFVATCLGHIDRLEPGGVSDRRASSLPRVVSQAFSFQPVRSYLIQVAELSLHQSEASNDLLPQF